MPVADIPPGSRAGRREEPARRARDLIRHEVLRGAYDERALPAESELAKSLGISRNAVRDALDMLRSEGLVQRRPGMGTFAATHKAVQGMERLRGLFESLPADAGPVANTVLAAEMVAAPAFVTESLCLEDGAPVVFIERLRTLGGMPLSLDTSYLDASVAAPLLDTDLVGTDVFVMLEEELGLRLAHADLSIEAIAADVASARLLEVPPGTPLLLVERLTCLEDGRPIDFEFVRYRGDRLSLSARLSRRVPPD